MTAIEFAQDIHRFCETNKADEVTIQKYARYFKTVYKGYGLNAPLQKQKAKELIQNQGLTFKEVIEAIPFILKEGWYDEISISLLVLDGYHKQFTHETFERIVHFYEVGINNWAHADIMGMLLLPRLVKKNCIQMADFKPWLNAGNKFQRRSVPVTLIKQLKTTEHYEPLFHFIEPLMMDTAREVHQGVGWFLREAWKLKKEPTEKFLLKWKDRCPRLIIQYATEKMTPNEKVKFRKTK